ncbi:hypothetical protein UCMB321_3426 [Pseudomonas batumici]|uniref:Uncharacterized protein n=1 Tax=Pseudomonas batumici TaxID=226910 RepID=A0A0C2I0Y9_9PSED|nr:hypothetical protein UCMB321_3426 [Pseudomonas batumici]
MLRIPGAGGLVIGNLDDDMAEAQYFRGRYRGPLSLVDAWLLVREIERKRGPVRQGIAGGLSMDGFHNESGGIPQPDLFADTRMRDGLDGRSPLGLGQAIQISLAANFQSEAEKACLGAPMNAVAVGCGVGCPEIKRIGILVTDGQAEVTQKACRVIKVRSLEDEVGKTLGLDCRGRVPGRLQRLQSRYCGTIIHCFSSPNFFRAKPRPAPCIAGVKTISAVKG